MKLLHHWKTLDDSCIPDIEKYIGFIYEVKCLLSGKKYIGKKNYKRWGAKKHRNYGTCNKWQFYVGSSKDLISQIKLQGISNFRFTILSQHKTKGELTYAEANLQHKRDVLIGRLPDGSRAYWNNQIAAIRFIPKVS